MRKRMRSVVPALLLVSARRHRTGTTAFRPRPLLAGRPRPFRGSRSSSQFKVFGGGALLLEAALAAGRDPPPGDNTMMERFAALTEFRRGGEGAGVDAGGISSPSGSADAAGSDAFEGGPPANQFYRKRMADIAERAKDASTSGDTVIEASPTPPSRGFIDFGIASEQAEPISGDSGVRDPAAAGGTKPLRGFTDLNAKRYSRPVQVEESERSNAEADAPSPVADTDSDGQTVGAGSNARDAAKPTDALIMEEPAVENEPAAVVPDAAEEAATDTSTAAAPAKEETSATSESNVKVDGTAASLSVAPAEPVSESVLTQTVAPTNPLKMPDINLNEEDFGLLPLVIIGVSLSLALGVYLDGADGPQREKEAAKGQQAGADESKNLLERVKDAGTAGAVSYALWEAAFWGVSVPVCLVGYRQATGHWPDLADGADLREVGLEAFAFVNVARLAVPLRIGLALSTVPWVERNIVRRFGRPSESGDGDWSATSAEVEGVQLLAEEFGDGGSLRPPYNEQVEPSSFSPEPESPPYRDGGDQTASGDSRAPEGRSNSIDAAGPTDTPGAVNAGIDPALLRKKEKRPPRAYVPGNSYLGAIDEYCEPGRVDEDCSGSIQGYLDSLARTGAAATEGEVTAIVGYLDTLSRGNVGAKERTGAAFASYLDALSMGEAPAPPSAKAVANYLDVLGGDDPDASDGTGARIDGVEERLGRLESSVDGLPDDIAARLADWQTDQDRKLSDEMERIRNLLIDGKRGI